jgi:hypothetical protein
VSLTKVAIFAVGYVVGAKAGRERYEQIVEVAGRASERLEDFSARHAATGQDGGARRPDRRA